MQISKQSCQYIVDSLSCRLFDKRKFLSELDMWMDGESKAKMLDATRVEIDALQLALSEFVAAA